MAAKRASLSRQQADALLNVTPQKQTEPGEAVGAAILDHIGHDAATVQRTLTEVPISRIRPNPFQPRWAVDEATVQELAFSIQQRGFFGILTARQRGRWYELAYGHQRLEAARRAGLETLPLEVKELSDEEMLEYALAENLQRKDLSQLEEGEIFLRWQEELGRSEREMAARLGKSKGYIRNRIETARLPEDLKALLREQSTRPAMELDDAELPARFELSASAAKELARVEDFEQRRRLTAEVLSRQLNLQQTRALVDRTLRPPTPRPKPTPSTPIREHLFGRWVLRLEEEVQRVSPEERDEAIRALDELIARIEQMRDSLRLRR